MTTLTRLISGCLFLGVLALGSTAHALDDLFSAEEIASSFTLPEVDDPPQPVEQAEPDLDGELKRITGIAKVAFLIDPTGNVVSPRIQTSSDARFDEPTIKAIQKWKFKPAKKGGNTVSVRVVLPFRFTSR